MIKPINNWNDIEPLEIGEHEQLKLGGHELVIKNAYQYTGQTGNTSLRIEVDIAGNDKQAGFYQRQYDNNPFADRKWPTGACKYVSLKEDENCLRMFKGFITAVEKSNPGYTWNWDETTLVGKKIAGEFGQEEYKDSKGEVRLATKLRNIRCLDKLNEIKIPKVKLLDGSYIDQDQYNNAKTSHETIEEASVEMQGDDIDKVIDLLE